MWWPTLIKIRGYTSPNLYNDPGTYEVFQGIGPGDSDPGDPGEQPSEPVDLEKLQQWLDAVNAWVAEEEAWIDATVAYADGTRNLPAPMPPQLPDITDFLSLPALIGQFGPWGVVIWVGLKIVRRVLEAWLEKKMNPNIGDLQQVLEDIRDALAKGMLFSDGEEGEGASILKAGLLFADKDDKYKGALDRGLIIEITTGDPPVTKKVSLLELLNMSVQDLAMVDAIIDFGSFRVNIKGKTIQYG